MILLDTNVVSELMRSNTDLQVRKWLRLQNIEELFLSSITIAEIDFGLNKLPDGRKKNLLQETFADLVLPSFQERILCFDEKAALSYGLLRANARSNGYSVATADGYIAAIAHSNKATVATRDVSPFIFMGLKVVNPWKI